MVIPGGGNGSAAARNAGWRAGSVPWVTFLHDDVVLAADWRRRLTDDLEGLPSDVGASRGRSDVPGPGTAPWAAADVAYRRAALAAVGGFDERFRDGLRQDADLVARVAAAGWRTVEGRRRCGHGARGTDGWAGARLEAGTADDVLLRAIHGRRWRQVTGVPPGRRRRHVAVTVAGLAGVAGAATGHPWLRAAGLAAWAAGTAELAWARIGSGGRTPGRVATVVATSAVVPPAATWHWLRGWVTLPRSLRSASPATRTARTSAAPLDRDGTVTAGEPMTGHWMPAAGIPPGVVSERSGPRPGVVAPPTASHRTGG